MDRDSRTPFSRKENHIKPHLEPKCLAYGFQFSKPLMKHTTLKGRYLISDQIKFSYLNIECLVILM